MTLATTLVVGGIGNLTVGIMEWFKGKSMGMMIFFNFGLFWFT